jgi:hypothetical protein
MYKNGTLVFDTVQYQESFFLSDHVLCYPKRMMPPLQLAWRIPRVFYSEAIPVAATQL